MFVNLNLEDNCEYIFQIPSMLSVPLSCMYTCMYTFDDLYLCVFCSCKEYVRPICKYLQYYTILCHIVMGISSINNNNKNRNDNILDKVSKIYLQSIMEVICILTISLIIPFHFIERISKILPFPLEFEQWSSFRTNMRENVIGMQDLKQLNYLNSLNYLNLKFYNSVTACMAFNFFLKCH